MRLPERLKTALDAFRRRTQALCSWTKSTRCRRCCKSNSSACCRQREFERVGDTQTIRVDTRVVAATNRNLKEEVRSGSFRKDLYYRLNVVPITLPPLRERREDIASLVSHFLQLYNEENERYVVHVQPQAMGRAHGL